MKSAGHKRPKKAIIFACSDLMCSSPFTVWSDEANHIRINKDAGRDRTGETMLQDQLGSKENKWQRHGTFQV